MVAESEETASAALARIAVELRPLDAVGSIEEALARPEPRLHEHAQHGNIHRLVSQEFGEVALGFAEADYVREDSFFYGGSTHLALEQHAALAEFSPDGRLTLWSSTQTPHYVHRVLARVLELPPARIRVIVPALGGGFAGKTDPFNHELVVAKLAMITGRPVKICLTREEVFHCHRGRHPTRVWIRTGVRRDGSISAMHSRPSSTAGPTAPTAPPACSTPARSRPSPTACRTTASRVPGSSPTSPPAVPSGVAARRRGASRSRFSSTRSPRRSASTRS